MLLIPLLSLEQSSVVLLDATASRGLKQMAPSLRRLSNIFESKQTTETTIVESLKHEPPFTAQDTFKQAMFPTETESRSQESQYSAYQLEQSIR